MIKVKITIAKTSFYADLAKDVDTEIEGTFGPCPVFKEGQTFMVNNLDEVPEGFCAWAWADIQRDVAMLFFGAKPSPRLKNEFSMYSSCDEGIRPVVFLLEKIEID